MSTLKVTNIQATGETASRAVSGVAAAWVNFNGTGTIATRDSENVSSLTDFATGRYYVNFSSNMANANYCFTLYTSATDPSSISAFANQYTGGNESTTSSFGTSSYNAAFVDSDVVTVAIHGDLA
jgi:hypothetical protein